MELLIDVELTLANNLWFHSSRLHHEVLEDLVERDVTTSDQEVQVVQAWWFVLYQDEQQVDGKGDQDFLLTPLVNCAEIGDTVA